MYILALPEQSYEMMKGTSIRRMLLQMEDRLLDWMIRRMVNMRMLYHCQMK